MIEARLGRELALGTVIVRGENKYYTEMVEDLSAVRYSDAEIVTYGDLRELVYTNPN